MTIRRLNLRIQGLPESYCTEPYMGESMVVGEPAIQSVIPPQPQMEPEVTVADMPPSSSPPPPMTASPEPLEVEVGVP